jgi:hypothetical protein
VTCDHLMLPLKVTLYSCHLMLHPGVVCLHFKEMLHAM